MRRGAPSAASREAAASKESIIMANTKSNMKKNPRPDHGLGAVAREAKALAASLDYLKVEALRNGFTETSHIIDVAIAALADDAKRVLDTPAPVIDLDDLANSGVNVLAIRVDKQKSMN
jgi:hypothetical protein